jgi:3-phenylpropionate/trans-cinnamate dioxygenase ferredoxin subunit
MGEFVAALKSSDVAEGSMIPVEAKDIHVLLTRIGGEVFAVSGTCTHEEADLALGFKIEERVTCPLHLSQFDLRTGEVLSPPATESLRSFKVKIEDDTIFVEV